MRMNSNGIWFQSHGTLRAEIALVNDAYRYSIYQTAHGMRQLLCQASESSLPAAKKAAFKAFDRIDDDSDAIDTDLEDQRAELLQEMAEEEHHCLEADEALSGMKDA